MKIKRLFILLFPFLLCFQMKAQNTVMIGDSIQLSIDGYKGGQIQWQFSKDKQIWNDLIGSKEVKLIQTVTNSFFYRAKVTNGCTYYSDTTLISTTSSDKSKIIFTKDIFINGESGYSYFRIPSLIKTSSNRIIAFAEGRKNGVSDTGDIDIVMKFSDDSGLSWSKMFVIWDDNANNCGNPSPVFDEINNVIWLVACWNNGQDSESQIMSGKSIEGRKVFVLNSKDDGITWSKAIEITKNVKNDNMKWYASGPCHGIQLKNGKYKNRLIIPCDNSIGNTYFSHVIYSDDLGYNWKLGGIVPTQNQNESTVSQLIDGRLILCMRNYDSSTKPFRTISYSSDYGITWSMAIPNQSLIEPICQGSLLSLCSNISTNSVLLFSNPSSSNNRNNLTIKMSFDEGISWNTSISIYKGPSAYSDLTEVKNNTVGIIFENGLNSLYEKISYSLIKLF